MSQSVIVLGGYGNFGKRIVENLSSISGLTIYIAGRSALKAQACIDELSSEAKAQLSSFIIDIYADDFEEKLIQLSPGIVIHTSGPFQGQDYHVPRACIQAGAHYIDLADDRRFVCDITELDALAKQQGILVVSGASSVPGLSSAVVSHYKKAYSQLECIDIAIAPGNKAERGEATLRGILSYTGHPLKVYRNGSWNKVYGWMSPRVMDFGDKVGKRCLANVDVPDLELFPSDFSVKNRVSFQAGLELSWLHYLMVMMAFMSKIKIVKDWSIFTKLIFRVSEKLKVFGSDSGAMRVILTGNDHESKSRITTWSLYAHEGIGPYIPTLSSIILARKLLNNNEDKRGAMPCSELFTLDEFMAQAAELGIYADEGIVCG
ncbi:MAG: saccharopine dehydrogenase NADP-binding domain-containing protein [Oleispira sp.]|nr:saccharopine dehydrogenase NADP-binding domain-containing protein [Oleispira sp.]MBL4882721.1 saccharopine dehydrogenase NADP-binding domain-containing protein [Oleispira sp.]